MRRQLLALGIIVIVVGVLVQALPSTTPIQPMVVEELAAEQSYNAITKISSSAYALGGELSTGTESWQVEPSIVIRGIGVNEPLYMLDGISTSEIDLGTVVSFAVSENPTVTTDGHPATLYGAASAGILDYDNGGTGIVHILAKSGTNQFLTVPFAYTDESLSDLAYDPDGMLWGAGMRFEFSGPVPVLGFFDEGGTFHPVDTSVASQSGSFQHVDFIDIDIGIAYGSASANDQPAQPLLILSYDAGQTWAPPPSLPWDVGTINAAQYVDPCLWVAGESPDGAAFAATMDGGTTWTTQTMPDATYIWDMKIARIAPLACQQEKSWQLGAALGTYVLEDGSKESIVFRTLDGLT